MCADIKLRRSSGPQWRKKSPAFLGVVCFVFKSVILFESVFVFLGGEAYNLFGSGEPWLHLSGKRRAFLFVRPPTKSRAKSGGGRREKINL